MKQNGIVQQLIQRSAFFCLTKLHFHIDGSGVHETAAQYRCEETEEKTTTKQKNICSTCHFRNKEKPEHCDPQFISYSRRPISQSPSYSLLIVTLNQDM